MSLPHARGGRRAASTPREAAALIVAKIQPPIQVVTFAAPPSAGRPAVANAVVELLRERGQAAELLWPAATRDRLIEQGEPAFRATPRALELERSRLGDIAADTIAVWSASGLSRGERRRLIEVSPGPVLIAQLKIPLALLLIRSLSEPGQTEGNLRRLHEASNKLNRQRLLREGFHDAVVVPMTSRFLA